MNECEADVGAGALGTEGATLMALHLLDPQSPASASCRETIASIRNETNRRRRVVFIVRKCCVPYYLLSGQKDNRVKGFASRGLDRCVVKVLVPGS